MGLHTTPENFRAEISRHMLVRCEIAQHIKMAPTQFTNYVNGNIPIPGWAAHNIGLGINDLTGLLVFDVKRELGYITPRRGRPQTSQRGMGLLPYVSKRAKRDMRRVKRREKREARLQT